jgi:hypothetical protein
MSEDERPREKFGERAVRMGFVTEEQVDDALEQQRWLREHGEGRRLTGIILLEMDALTNEQLIEVLQSYEDESGEATE